MEGGNTWKVRETRNFGEENGQQPMILPFSVSPRILPYFDFSPLNLGNFCFGGYNWWCSGMTPCFVLGGSLPVVQGGPLFDIRV